MTNTYSSIQMVEVIPEKSDMARFITKARVKDLIVTDGVSSSPRAPENSSNPQRRQRSGVV